MKSLARHVAPTPTNDVEGVLSAEQKEFYAREGYVVIRKLISDEVKRNWALSAPLTSHLAWSPEYQPVEQSIQRYL